LRRALDITFWKRYHGNYEQQNGRGMLRRVFDVRGRTAGWDIEVDHIKIGHAKRLMQAKLLAARLTASSPTEIDTV
jgi:hypothetical protein